MSAPRYRATQFTKVPSADFDRQMQSADAPAKIRLLARRDVKRDTGHATYKRGVLADQVYGHSGSRTKLSQDVGKAVVRGIIEPGSITVCLIPVVSSVARSATKAAHSCSDKG